MASTAKKKTAKASTPNKGLTDTQRWVLGVVLFAFAVFLMAAVAFYYIYWTDDQHLVSSDAWRPDGGVAMNPAGKTGAILAHYVVGQWFGVFGLVLPIVLIILALRIINYRPAILRKSVRISLVVMILGSLSLGFLFGDKWGVFGSGLGGYHGIVVSDWIRSLLGTIGTGIALLLGWILIGVYINSKRTISVVNKVSKGIYDGGVKVGGVVIDHAADIVSHKNKKNEDDQIDNYVDLRENEPAQDKPREIEVVDDISDSPVVEQEQDTFEITDSRMKTEQSYSRTSARNGVHVNEIPEQDGVFSVISACGEEPVVATEQANPVSNVITLGDDAGEFIVGGTVAGSTYSDDSRYAGVVGGGAAVDGGAGSVTANRAHTQQRSEFDRGLEVLEREANQGVILSAGGVVEAASEFGVKPHDELRVVVAGHKDAQLSNEEIDESLYDPTKELPKFQKPPVEILEDHSVDVQVTEEEVYANKNQIVKTLENFGIKIDKIKATIGPTVTLYEIVPAAGVKISKIKNLEDDIALSLKALGIRIIAPMPGKGTVGIEVPNKDKEIVSMYSVIKTMKFQESNYELPIVLGKTISNETFMIDLAKLPHLLVAGATGQGKSVGLNAIIASLIYKKHPAELKFVMVDPKRVELSLYAKLEKHYLAKMASEEDAILTDTQKVVYTLNALCVEMSNRYDLLRKAEVKKLSEYNEKFLKRRLNPNKGHKFMPYIVVIIDEFADMIMTAGREVETPITRLAQLARAVGIHLVIATQRPDVKVITGLIKANFPARIAFRVMSMVDSRTIIDQPGANQLIGRGDMLISLNGELTRVQCAFIDTPEIERMTEFISRQKGYPSAYELPDYLPEGEGGSDRNADMGQIDSMFEDVARFVVQNQQGSTSSIQRRFSIGYNRAGRIMDQLEVAGVVGRAEGSKPREVLIMDVQSLEYILGKLDS